jgi:hypothetical protein
VRAYYIVAQNSLDVEPVLVSGNLEQEEFSYQYFDPAEVSCRRADDICDIFTREEELQIVIEQRADSLLSYGMMPRYREALLSSADATRQGLRNEKRKALR